MAVTGVTASMGNQLRRLWLEYLELSQVALAHNLGITWQSNIANEGGRCKPSSQLAMRIAGEFNGGVDAVFFWTTQPTGVVKTTLLSTHQ